MRFLLKIMSSATITYNIVVIDDDNDDDEENDNV